MTTLEILGKIVRFHRIKNGKSINQFASEGNFRKRSTVTNIEYGRSDIKFSSYIKLPGALGMSFSQLGRLIDIGLKNGTRELEVTWPQRRGVSKTTELRSTAYHNFKVHFGLAVKTFRSKNKIPLNVLLKSFQSGSNSFASGVEQGSKCPRLSTTFEMCKALGILPSELLNQMESTFIGTEQFTNRMNQPSMVNFKDCKRDKRRGRPRKNPDTPHED